jgi:hypothetical protein
MFVFKSASLFKPEELTNKEMVAPHLPITLLLFIILAFAQALLSLKTKMPITNCILY